MTLRELLGDVHFGAPKDDPPEWREIEDEDENDGDSDVETPSEVIAMLGFDPQRESDENG